MNVLRLAFKTLGRDWRSGELLVLLAALIVAVAAMTAVGFFTDRIAQAVNAQAAEVLAADLVVRSPREIRDEYLSVARDRGLRATRTLSFPSVVFAGEAGTLVSIYAVADGYPLRGRMRISRQPFAPPVPTDLLPVPGEVWADAKLLARLGAAVGDSLKVGDLYLTVSRVLDYRPDQGWRFVDVAPTLLLNLADAPATGLVQPGSRVSYSVLVAGNPAQLAAYRDYLEPSLTDSEQIRDIKNAQPEIRRALRRAERFLGLAGLVSTLIAAVAVAMAARRYAQRHIDSVALMKTMGARQRQVVNFIMLQLLLLAGFAGVVGSLIGYLAQHGLMALLVDVVGTALPWPSLKSAGLGVVTAAVVLSGFALPPLLQLKTVPPARVLRKDLEPPPLRYATTYGLAAVVVGLMVFWIVRDWLLLGLILLGCLVTVGALWFSGRLLVAVLARLRSGAGVAWRYGIANLARRGRETSVQLVAFGVGLMALLLLTLVRNDLMNEWRASLPDNAANNFLINIQPHETDGVHEFFAARGMVEPRLSPLTRARLTHINGTLISEIEFEERWAADREQNLSWSDDLQESNRVINGSWWNDRDSQGGEVSVEEEFANRLRLRLDDELTFDVAGESVSARVTSIRRVQWDTFRPNFFMVFSPDVLKDYPATYVTGVFVDENDRSSLYDLVRKFPGITIIDIDSILGQVRSVMDKSSLAVQYVFLFTLLAGLTVLLAAIQTTRDERMFESAILRTLGARRSVVLQGVAAEFSALGLLAGLLAATGASLVGYLLAVHVFELEYVFDPGLWLMGAVAGTLVVGLSGTLATRSVVNKSPASTLRQV